MKDLIEKISENAFRRVRPTVALAGVLLLGLGACGKPQVEAPKEEPGTTVGTSTARFDWFEYRGLDAQFEQPLQDGEYRNPIFAGFYPDPSLVQVGGDYYLVHSTFSWFPGIPVFHSRDLVNWTQIGNVIDRPEQLDFANLGMSRGVFAPGISYNDGTFYVVNTCVDCGGNFIATAKNPAGPWSDPVWLPQMGGIDPSLFFDDDGRAYIINNDAPEGEPLYDGHRALWVQEFDPQKLKLIGPRKMVVSGGVDISQKPVWIEGPHLFRRNGQLYLIAAEGGTSVNHSQVVLKGETPFGPFEPWNKNPILTQRHLDPQRENPVTSVGHADFVQDAEDNWWAVFLGTRPYEGNYYNTGRETFLMPVTWEDGWPVITRGEELIPAVAEKPALAEQPAPAIPTSGNFTLRDEFNGPDLPPYWLRMRQPQGENWYQLENGALVLEPRSESIGAFGRPALLARRQQHTTATASTALRYKPQNSGDRAGLVALQNDEYFYFFGLELGENQQPRLALRRRAGSESEEHGNLIASTDVELTGEEPLQLRIDARGGEYDFSYSTDGEDWSTLLQNADGKILSTDSAGGFVGSVFGLYAYRENGAQE